jgi:5-methylcytosine-specific restriction endonuclease McrA
MAQSANKSDGFIEGGFPCLTKSPYRMVVFHSINQHKIPLYIVAGSEKGPAGAEPALKEAISKHGATCFYCKKELTTQSATIDHVEAKATVKVIGIHNLVISCKPCNASKGHKPIESYSPNAGKEWLSALLKQVEDRLQRLSK